MQFQRHQPDRRHAEPLDRQESTEHDFAVLDDHELKVFTGRTREQFDELAAELDLRSSFDEKRSTILGVYLAYLYAGFTQEQISATFTVPRKTVADYIKLGRDSLDFVREQQLGATSYD